MKKAPETIVVVDDEELIRLSLSLLLKRCIRNNRERLVRVLTFSRSDEALQYLRAYPVSFTLCDATGEGILPLDVFYRELQKTPNAHSPFFIMSANPHVKEKWGHLGTFIDKTIAPERFVELVREACFPLLQSQ